MKLKKRFYENLCPTLIFLNTVHVQRIVRYTKLCFQEKTTEQPRYF